jgi:lipoprotein-anchoring transpeptidase ErfK/SrfK
VPRIFSSVLMFVPRLILASLVAGIFIVQPQLGEPTSAAQPAPSGTHSVWISETGQTMSGAFLDYWIAHPEIGNPVSGAVIEGELWSQWFEYARLELEPGPFEAMTVDQVHRHQIGRSFAIRAGYTEGLNAFKPLTEGPDRFFPETGHSLTMGFRSFYEQPGVPARMGWPISEEFDIGNITYQFFEYGAFSWGPEAVAQFVPLGRLDAGVHGQLAKWQPQPWDAVDWDSTGLDMMDLSYQLPGERTIEVNLTTFMITARVGEKVVLESIASTGVPQSPTVTGHFTIYLKHRIQSLSVIGWDGNLYEAPNTPWVMYFFEDYAFHSSLWRTEYGLMDSQGCVVPPMDVAEALWLWADYGTPVWIHY